MIDLGPSINHFLSILCKEDWEEIESDRNVVAKIRDRSPDADAVLARWLHDYKVLMGYTSPTRQVICNAIVNFAWSEGRPTRVPDAEAMLREFKALESTIQTALLTDSGKAPRSVTSLCSKALWVCYPDDIPIYDRNARVSLAVLSRLCGLPAESCNEDYQCFLTLWFNLYRNYGTPFKTDAMRSRFGYAVRAFDRFLWYLSAPISIAAPTHPVS